MANFHRLEVDPVTFSNRLWPDLKSPGRCLLLLNVLQLVFGCRSGVSPRLNAIRFTI